MRTPTARVATVVAVHAPTCTVRIAATGEMIEAVAGFALQDLVIALRSGDHVIVEDAHPFPVIIFRFWRATVTEAHERHVVIDPPSSGGQRNPTMRLPRRFSLSPSRGETVLCTREVVADIEVAGEASDPGRLLTAYHHIRDAVTGPEACLRIPAEELAIDERLVTALVEDQFPIWAGLPIRHVPSWENAMFRLGGDLAVRLTKGRWALGQLEKELRWLPMLAAHLSLPIPVPLVLGRPGFGYPWTWSVCTWVDGDDASPERITDQAQAGRDLAAFLLALQSIDATGGPVAGQPPHWYGWRPYELEAPQIRRTLDRYPAQDRQLLIAAFDKALAAPPWDGPPVWLHGDLCASNVVARNGQLTGVIDFGVMSTGDPAYDYAGAWALLDSQGRHAFRGALDTDDATWTRARGWALRRNADQVLTDERGTSR